MSGLSDLIKINRNIEAQNEEIIRLLKIIAGEEENKQPEENTLFPSYVMPQAEEISIETDFTADELGEGEVYIIEDMDVFRLSVKNNETTIDNLTGSAVLDEYDAAETALNEMNEKGMKFDAPTVILSEAVCGHLPQILGLCVDIGIKKVYIPIKASIELLGAPPELPTLIDMEVYKNVEQLTESIVGVESDD
ncbi:hypothetical protein [Methanobrevibacter sp.]|uniref:hypothetical protein n=1 Tax=Methanobrevibacter sp. TaxID=66852 RepID=UPI00388EB049